MNQDNQSNDLQFEIIKTTVKATSNPDPVFHKLGLKETARFQNGKPLWDGYHYGIDHHIGDEIVNEVEKYLSKVLKKDD